MAGAEHEKVASRASAPFLIELPEELKAWLRLQKPERVSLRRYIVSLLYLYRYPKLYNYARQPSDGGKILRP
jgi:hypothetical protein